MKRLVYLLLAVFMIASFGCSETVDVDIPENYEKADITGVTVYNALGVSVASKATITAASKEVLIVLTQKQELEKLKISLTISPGATVIKPLGTGILDFTSPKTVTIVSPGKSVTNEWVIQITNP